MPRFIVDHLEDCTPLSPCSSCQALSLLKKNLKPEALKEFMLIMSEAYGISDDDSPAESKVAVNLDSDLSKAFPSLSTRLSLGLLNDNIKTVEELLKKTELELRRIPNIGDVSIDELKKALADAGLSLAG